jgi:hypothetical protein
MNITPSRFLAALLVCVAAVDAAAQNKPNVVIMLADNVGYGDIGAYGAGEVRGRVRRRSIPDMRCGCIPRPSQA